MSAEPIIAQAVRALPLLVGVVALVALQRASLWRPVVRGLDAIANRRGPALLVVASVAVLHYAALALHQWPIPIHADEFSYLLMADTFTDGRLTNPTPPLSYLLWAPDVIFEPTYQSKYPPAQGVLLALGEWLAGDPLVGVWLGMAAACAAACWLMQRWLRPRWALLGGLTLATHKALATFWGSTYFGGGAAMLGGALLYGALPRLLDRPRARHAVLLAAGLALLANSRPFEGLVACLPAAAVLTAWLVRRRAWRSPEILRRVVVPVVAVLAVTGAAMGVYHRAVTGSPLKMPYQVFLESSSVANMALPGDPQARTGDEPSALIERHFKFYTLGGDPHLWLPLLLLPLAVRHHRWMRLALAAVVLTYFAVWLTVLASPHYAAPVTALLFTLYFQCVRHLRALLRRRRLLFQLFVAVFLVLWAAQLADSRRFHAERVQPGDPHHYSVIRAELLGPLESDDDRHLIVVPWDNRTSRVLTWVNNAADVEAAKIVWAWQGVGLAERFGERRCWLLDESVWPPVLVPTSPAELAWVLRLRDGAKARLETGMETRLESGGSARAVRVEIEDGGAKEASIQLARAHPALQAGARYTLRLRARSDAERTIGVQVSHGDGRALDAPELRHRVTLGREWREHSLRYAADEEIDHVGLELWLGGSTTAVEIDTVDVRVEAPTADGTTADGTADRIE
jgi:hypothetical protein